MKNRNIEEIGHKLAKKTFKWFKKYYGELCKYYNPHCPKCRAYIAYITLFEEFIEYEESCETQ